MSLGDEGLQCLPEGVGSRHPYSSSCWVVARLSAEFLPFRREDATLLSGELTDSFILIFPCTLLCFYFSLQIAYLKREHYKDWLLFFLAIAYL